ncbi:MAG TPA: AAA family ATPase [Polyangiaceae bacterium]|nr:AAA family ATPase [Polyangiaceae bacterium]
MESARPRVASFSELSTVDAWWRGRDDDADITALSPAARRLRQNLLLLERSCPRRLLSALGDHAALDELVLAGLVDLRDGRARLTDEDTREVELDPVAAADVAAAILAHDPDAWGAMRAAELFVAAGDLARAHCAARAAIREAADAALRADLWDRFDQCLGHDLCDDDLVRYGQLALERGDVQQALRLARRGDSQQSYAVALLAGRTSLARGDLRRARTALDDAVALAADEDALAVATVELAELELVQGEREAAREHAQQAQSLTDDPATHLGARNVEGKILLAEGDWDAAIAHFTIDEERAMAYGRDLDALRARLNLAIAVMSEGRRTEARALLEEILQTGEELGDRRASCFALANLSVLATLDHDYAEGMRLVERAIEEMRPLGDTLRLARQIINLAALRLKVGLVTEAEQALVFGRQACGTNLADALVANMSMCRAKVGLAQGNTLAAATAAEEAIAAAGRSSNGAKLGEASRLAARIALEDGDVPRAQRYLERASSAASGPDSSLEQAILEALTERAAGEPFGDLARHALQLAIDSHDVDLSREAHELCFHAALIEDQPDDAREHLDAARRLRDRVAASLPEELRERFLARREMRRLDELEARLDDEPTPETRPSRGVSTRRRNRSGEAPVKRLVGDSAAMVALRTAIDKVGRSSATVLIHGESGTGKELVADALHRASDRADGPMVKVNCAALVETLLLSELFGHEKGAFTGASGRKRGRFEQAHRGTIFLDEIGDISPKTQVALLRVLQERSFERVGGTSPIEVDVRVVCATHRDLRAMVSEGSFREDLYYRLCGVTLDVPSFRARIEDLPIVAEALLERIASEMGTGKKQLTDEAIEGLMRHHWPGNIRELDNALRAAALFSEGPLIKLRDFADNVASLADLAKRPSPSSATSWAPVSGTRSLDPTEALYHEVKSGQSLPEMKKALEKACIMRALEETGGNITQAAKLLGMKRPRVSQLVNQFARDEEVAS